MHMSFRMRCPIIILGSDGDMVLVLYLVRMMYLIRNASLSGVSMLYATKTVT